MLHYPQQKAPPRSRGETAMAFGAAGGRACVPEAECKGHGFYRVCASGNSMGSCHRRQLFISVLLVGFRQRKREGVRKNADGVLLIRCQESWKIRRLYAGRQETESLAF